MIKEMLENLKKHGSHWQSTEIEALAESVIIGEISEEDIPADICKQVVNQINFFDNDGTTAFILASKKKGAYGEPESSMHAKTIQTLAFKVMAGEMSMERIKDENWLREVKRSIEYAKYDGREEEIKKALAEDDRLLEEEIAKNQMGQ